MASPVLTSVCLNWIVLNTCVKSGAQEKKLSYSTEIIIFLRVEIDTIKMKLRSPEQKFSEIKVRITEVLASKKFG